MISQSIKLIFRTFLVFLGVLALMLIVQALYALIGFTLVQDLASAEQLLIERISPVTVAVILILWAKNRKEQIYEIILQSISIRKNNLILCFNTILTVLFILYFLFFISGLLNQYEFNHFGIEKYPSITIIKQIIFIGLFGNILIAIGEEIIFRGFLLNYIINLTDSKLFGVLFTSFVFSLHPYIDFLNYVIAFLAGLLMAYAYLKFKSLYISMGIHFAYNLFNFTIASEPGYGPQLPYLVKFDYTIILDGLGAWVDLFIILGFLFVFVFIWFMKPVRQEKRLRKVI